MLELFSQVVNSLLWLSTGLIALSFVNDLTVLVFNVVKHKPNSCVVGGWNGNAIYIDVFYFFFNERECLG